MKIAFIDQTPSPYTLCQYSGSRHFFRGPAKALSAPYVAILGGSLSFGKEVKKTYTEGIETLTGMAGVNLAIPQSGPDAYLAEKSILNIARGAVACVIELGGVQNCSNAFYKTHPRRNDRFIAPTPALVALYPDVDFTNIHFTRHLLKTLFLTDADRFADVKRTLTDNWLEKIEQLINHVQVPSILIWPQASDALDLNSDAMFITQPEIDILSGFSHKVVRIQSDPKPGGRNRLITSGTLSEADHLNIAAKVSPWLLSIEAQHRPRAQEIINQPTAGQDKTRTLPQ